MSKTYHLLVVLELFEFVVELLNLRLCILALFSDCQATILNSFNLELVFYVFLHEFLFLGEVFCQKLLSVGKGIFDLCNLNRCDVSEHLMVPHRHSVPIVVKPDSNRLRQHGRIAA